MFRFGQTDRIDGDGVFVFQMDGAWILAVLLMGVTHVELKGSERIAILTDKFNDMAIFGRDLATPDANHGGGRWETSEACGEANVNNRNLARMSADELWDLREEISTVLSTRLGAEKQRLERRLARLEGRAERSQTARRPYPKVHPKYRNPERPSETWSGRGKQPRWVAAQLRSGMKVGDLLISQTH